MRQRKPNASQTTQESNESAPPNAPEFSNCAHLFILEDCEAVIQMIIKGRSPHMHHVCQGRFVLTRIGFLTESTVSSHFSVTYVHDNQQVAYFFPKVIHTW